jgi:hypothetical protein
MATTWTVVDIVGLTDGVRCARAVSRIGHALDSLVNLLAEIVILFARLDGTLRLASFKIDADITFVCVFNQKGASVQP